jgi:hypothetical protein
LSIIPTIDRALTIRLPPPIVKRSPNPNQQMANPQPTLRDAIRQLAEPPMPPVIPGQQFGCKGTGLLLLPRILANSATAS